MKYGLFLLLLVLVGCEGVLSVSLSDTTSGTLPEDTALRKTFDSVSEARSLDVLTCEYGVKSYVSDNRVTRTVIYGLGERPSQVNVTKDQQTVALPSIKVGSTPSTTQGGGWTATGHALDCSITGCAAGSYAIEVVYDPALTSCPLKLSLEVQAAN